MQIVWRHVEGNNASGKFIAIYLVRPAPAVVGGIFTVNASNTTVGTLLAAGESEWQNTKASKRQHGIEWRCGRTGADIANAGEETSLISDDNGCRAEPCAVAKATPLGNVPQTEQPRGSLPFAAPSIQCSP